VAEIGVHGVIVSDEPALPQTCWTADDKVDSYLDASDAFLALCTGDDQLTDGTIQCRPNIIDEIERARQRPNLRYKIIVFKAASVRLPSNINPIYEQLDPWNISAANELIARQLETWGVIATRPVVPVAPALPVAVDTLVSSVELGEHDKASRLAYEAESCGRGEREGCVDSGEGGLGSGARDVAPVEEVVRLPRELLGAAVVFGSGGHLPSSGLEVPCT
jgi:hypothetical protein